MDRESQERYLNKLASRNVCDGVLYEPRLYHDYFVLPANQTLRVDQHDGAFRNGEQWPVRIRYILAIMGRGDTQSPPVVPAQGDERLIQRVGMRVRAYDAAYMNQQHIPLALWHNRNLAGPSAVSRGLSCWQFDHAVPQGSRDSFNVEAQLLSNPPNARGVEVQFTGVGRASRTPRVFSGRQRYTDTVASDIDINQFRNAGAEVVDITQLSVFVESDEQSSNPSGDVQEASIQIQQVGGTGRKWAIAAPNESDRAPAGLWGVSVGRAMVHELPGDGWLWQPGQGVSVDLLPLVARTVSEMVWIGMAGHIVVT